jgi:uroporphyrinogen decarboxylase
MAYHFGDAVSMRSVLELFPKDIPILGNVHPAKFTAENEAAFAAALEAAKGEYGAFPNFVLSSGCDIAPDASIKALEAMMRV